MDRQWKHIRFEALSLSDLGNGFFGSNMVEFEGFEVTFIQGKEGAGHGFHKHEDLAEILIFLEGECDFSVDGKDMHIKERSLLFIPCGVNHKVRYRTDSKVLRMKVRDFRRD